MPKQERHPIYLVVGVPGVGKSWVCGQLLDKFQYVANDDYIGGDYVTAIRDAARESNRPVMCEALFSLSAVKDPLERQGFEVVCVFILEDEAELKRRWEERGNVSHATRQGHLSRQRTYSERAREYGSFYGTSAEVLEHLKTL